MPSPLSRKERSPSLRDEHGLPWRPMLAGAAAFVASFLTITNVHFFAPYLYGDVRFYENWGNWTTTHLMPYRDFPLEYPPGALLSFIFPIYARKTFGYIGTYYSWFRIELLLIALVGILVAGWTLKLLGASRRRAYAVLLFIGFAPLALGAIALSRYDYLPAVLTGLALALLLAGKGRASCGVIAAGFVVKIYPLLLLPIALLVLARTRGRRGALEGAGVALLVSLAGFLPFALLAWEGLKHGMTRQVVRPPQIESLVGAIWIGAHHLFGFHIHSVKSYGSDNFATHGARLGGTISSIVVVALLVVIWIWFARSARDTDEIVLAFAASVAVYVTFAKVLSPQYLLWLFPLVPMVRGRRGLWATVLLGIATILTGLWEPWDYAPFYKAFALHVSVIMITRDLVLIAMTAVLMWPKPLEQHAEQLDPVGAAVV